MMAWKKTFLLSSLGILLVIALPMEGGAKTFEERSLPGKGGLVFLSAAASVPYFASKMIYALSGSLVAGGINLFSLGLGQETATSVGTQAVNGDWIVYPAVFTGERTLQFAGNDESLPLPAVVMIEGE